QIVAFPFEEVVGLHVQHHVQISRRAAAKPGFPFAGNAELGAVVHTGGNLDVDFALSFHLAGAAAIGARFPDDAAFPAAGRARPAVDDAAERRRLHELLLAGAVAGGARLRPGARLGARAAARVAVFSPGNRDVRLHAEDGIFELDGQVVLQIGAAFRRVRIAPSAAAEKDVEQVAETAHVAEAAVEAASGTEAAHRTVRRGVAEPVVGGPLLLVAQHFI